jgi:hypothetical protein
LVEPDVTSVGGQMPSQPRIAHDAAAQAELQSKRAQSRGGQSEPDS